MRRTPPPLFLLPLSPAACRVLDPGAVELVCSDSGELPELGALLHRGSAEVPALKPAPLRSDFFLFVRRAEREIELQQESTSRHCWSPTLSRMMKPGIGCPEGSAERVEGPASGSRQKMMGTGTTRSGSRCPPLFFLLLLGSSCHMLHGQGKSITPRSPGFKYQRMH